MTLNTVGKEVIMRIVISNSSGIPIYEQIKEGIKSSILSGELQEGEMLPSIRQLAKELKVSVITTTRAYNDLQYEGFVTNVQGKGCYVLAQDNEMLKEQQLREIEECFEKAIVAAKRAQLSREELKNMLDFILEGCPSAQAECIEDAAEIHGINLTELLEALNK